MKRFLLFFALVFVLGRPALGAEPQGPALETPQAKLAAALHCPATFADTDHEPVFLVHGTFAEDESNWGWTYRPALEAMGFDVCTVDLPGYSLGDMQIQAEYVVHGIREIAARTGERVDVIGSSQGTLHPRWAIKWWPDIRTSVDDLIQLAPPNHGTDAAAMASVFGRCYASCWQMATGSNYITALNDGDESPGDVSYTSIYTLFDELVQPQLPESTSVLDGASNILIQDLCPGRPVEHAGLATGDAVGFALALDALTHPGAADTSRFDITTCAKVLADGADPAALFSGEASGGFDGDFVEEEPQLKSYARSSTPADDGPAPAPNGSDSDPQPSEDSSDEVAVLASSVQEVKVGDDALPNSGANIVGYVAVAMTLVAGGLAATRTAASRRSRRDGRPEGTSP